MAFTPARSAQKTIRSLTVKGNGYTFSVHGENLTQESSLEDFVALKNIQWASENNSDLTWSETRFSVPFFALIEAGAEIKYNEEVIRYRISAQIECCGETLILSRFTNTCASCGADYNQSGSLLAARQHWGEETGEHWTDCY